jgi:hypothetical protein
MVTQFWSQFNECIIGNCSDLLTFGSYYTEIVPSGEHVFHMSATIRSPNNISTAAQNIATLFVSAGAGNEATEVYSWEWIRARSQNYSERIQSFSKFSSSSIEDWHSWRLDDPEMVLDPDNGVWERDFGANGTVNDFISENELSFSVSRDFLRTNNRMV